MVVSPALPGRDPADGPEQLRREIALRVAGDVDLGHLDAAELLLVLGDVVLNAAADLLDVDVGVRQDRELLLDVARDPGDVIGGHDSAAVVVRDHLALDPLGRDPERVREAAEHDPLAAGRTRQVGSRDLRLERRGRADQDVAARIEDVAPRGRDRDVADAVDGRLRQILVARQHLQEPEPEEDDREQRQREAAGDSDPQRELRRHRWPAVLGSLGHHEPRVIWPRRCDGCCKGLNPPVVYARRRRRRGSSGSADPMTLRTSAYTGSASSVLTSTVMKIC